MREWHLLRWIWCVRDRKIRETKPEKEDREIQVLRPVALISVFSTRSNCLLLTSIDRYLLSFAIFCTLSTVYIKSESRICPFIPLSTAHAHDTGIRPYHNWCWKSSQTSSLVSRPSYALSSCALGGTPRLSVVFSRKRKASQISEPAEAQETDMTENEY